MTVTTIGTVMRPDLLEIPRTMTVTVTPRTVAMGRNRRHRRTIIRRHPHTLYPHHRLLTLRPKIASIISTPRCAPATNLP